MFLEQPKQFEEHVKLQDMQRLNSFTFGNLELFRLVTGPVQENCYLLRADTGAAVLVDPGEDAADILELVKKTNSSVKAILLTHAHFDHVGAVQATREALKVEVWLHPEARDQFMQSHLAAARWNIPFAQPDAPDHELLVGAWQLGELELEVLFTPGHAPGHVSLYSKADGFVLSGDALFKSGIGRTDLPGSDHATLISSIRTKLFTLPDETVVFSGHGEETTIAREVPNLSRFEN
jgi:hydroxyacylglutathione hydrolase